MKKTYLLEVILIIILFFVAVSLYLRYTVLQPLQVQNAYEPNENFGVVVDEYKWEGKLQPGRYTKNGVLIIKQ
jgi:heme/copper-type cytochrome/quinol oxidase subunit 2